MFIGQDLHFGGENIKGNKFTGFIMASLYQTSIHTNLHEFKYFSYFEEKGGLGEVGRVSIHQKAMGSILPTLSQSSVLKISCTIV